MFKKEKLGFNEVDRNQMPIQFFFYYDLTDEELVQFLAEYADEDEIDTEKEYHSIELCLNMYSSSDFKLEAFLNYSDGGQDVFDVLPQTSEARELIDILKNTDTEQAREAYNLYLYVSKYDRYCLEKSFNTKNESGDIIATTPLDLVLNKEANVKYWDEIDAVISKHIENCMNELKSWSVSDFTVTDDMSLAAAKAVGSVITRIMQEMADAEFPYCDTDY